MEGKLSIALLFAVVVGSSAYASNPTPVVAYTFACTGTESQRSGPCPSGGRPGPLIASSDGNFYGAAQVSSEGRSQPDGGTVFSLTPAGKFTLLQTFLPGPNQNYAKGDNPGLLIEGPDGNLYGTTLFGGIRGFGVLYRVSKQGRNFKIIHQFCSAANCLDGFPGGSLVVGADGNIYGTTIFGGTGSCYQSGCGTIFRVIPSSGTYNVIFNLNGNTDGAFPGGLTLAPDGTFFGFAGNMFHYSPGTGSFQTISLRFPTFGNGLPSRPTTGLTLHPNGKFYGLYTIYAMGGAGLFEVDPDGSNLTLFPEYNTTRSGGSPEGVLLASDGNFWIADFNGSTGYGDIVKLSPSQGTVLQTLAPFGASAAVGAYPAGLIQAKDGVLWGSTFQYGKVPAGHFADGVVFSLNAGLPPR